MAMDPVCDMDIDGESAPHRTEYQEKTYYFCSATCKNAFEAKPGKYLSRTWYNIVNARIYYNVYFTHIFGTVPKSCYFGVYRMNRASGAVPMLI